MEAATAGRPAASLPAPARRAPARRKPPARKPPVRRTPVRRPGGQLIPLAVGTAGAVRRLPDSGLMVRMTRGRAWIAVLGLLLVGIVAVNVVTLSIAASAGHIDQNIQALEEENPLLRSRDAKLSGTARVRHDAATELGMVVPTADQVAYVQAGPRDVAIAAERLAGAGPG